MKCHKRYRKRLNIMKKYRKIFFFCMNKHSFIETIKWDFFEEIAKNCLSLEKIFIGQMLSLIDDDNLEPLLQCKKVKQLDISLSEVSSYFVSEILVALPELRLLDLSLCHKIRKSHVKKWRELYPQVSIMFDSDRLIVYQNI